MAVDRDTHRIGEYSFSGYVAGSNAFTLRTNDLAFGTLFADRFRDLRRRDDSPGDSGRSDEVVFDVISVGEGSHPWGVWRDGEPCETMLAENYVLVHLVWELNRLVVDSVGDRLPVHAAAVAKNGRALLLPGPSHAGKSTLTGWLVAEGWEYVTDEMSVVELESLTVTPYQRPIGVRPSGPLRAVVGEPPEPFATFGEDEWLVPASTIGPGRLAGPCTVVGLVFPRYATGSDCSLTVESGAEALVKVAEQAPTRLAGGRAAFRRMTALVESLPRWNLAFDELSPVGSLLEPLVEVSRG